MRRGLLRYVAVDNIYQDAVLVVSLRKFFNWNNAVLQLNRNSDDDLKYVFFNGNEITLDSKVSNDPETPTAQSLSDWLGGSSSDVNKIIAQKPDGIYNADDVLTFSLLRWRFINSGNDFVIKNGKKALFGNGLYFRDGGFLSSFNNANNFSVFAVFSNTEANGGGYLGTISATSGNRLSFYGSSLTDKRMFLAVTTGGSFFAFYINQVNTINQRLHTTIKNGNIFSSFYNSQFQDDVTISGTYNNNAFLLGGERTNSRINDTFQELIIFPTDKTGDLSIIHTEINNYYGIY